METNNKELEAQNTNEQKEKKEIKKLVKKVFYKGKIILKTGLQIGGTNTAMGIGGLNKMVVRNPLSNIPYIPGSSLKGKMRSLIEVCHGWVSDDFGVSNDPNSPSGKLFGTATGNDKNRPSRLIVRDAELVTDKNEAALNEYGITENEVLDFSNTDLPYTESKTEVAINRVTAGSTPRTYERVPAGAIFKLDMVLNIFEGEDEEKTKKEELELKKTLEQAIGLLEDDYLGGNGSRGYGQVKIILVKPEGEEKTYEELDNSKKQDNPN